MDLAVEREQLAVALLQAGVKAAVGALVPGGAIVVRFVEEIAPAFSRAAWAWFSRLAIANRQHALDGLAQMPVKQARQVAEKSWKAATCLAMRRLNWLRTSQACR